MMYRLIVIHSCAKSGMTMSKDKKAVTRTWRHFKNPINLTLRLKVNIVSVSWMYATQRLMVIDLCTKYDLPVSKQSRGNITGTKRCQKKLQTWPWGQRSTSIWNHECTLYIISWWCTYVPNMECLCQSKQEAYGPHR